MKTSLAILFFLAAAMVVYPVMASASPIAAKETLVVQRIRLEGTDRELGMGIAEFPPNAEKPRHMATGPELAYVLEGELIVQVDGEPTKVLHAGGSYQLAANVVHVTKAGPAAAKVIASWVHVPGKAFNILVPR
ncbi:MAG: cupin domain-containing protein [Collimonas pratensis]|uniref:cupin domain-containing protein n=1 Tax=Collimonas pratensis TaxID=279113 RepID=UPI003C761411